MFKSLLALFRTRLVQLNRIVVVGLAFIFFQSCSSSPDVKQHRYATLKKEWTYEYEFPTVWRAIEKALEKHKIVDRDPDEVSSVELKKLEERSLETDWIYSRSRDKFITFEVNGLPKKKYLQVRYRYEIEAERALGGTHVEVEMEEEIERLSDEGQSEGWESVEKVDSSRTNELLNRIKMAILADHKKSS